MKIDLWEEQQDGYDAAKDELGPDANPYTPNSDQWKAWHQGWERFHTDVADKASSIKYCF